MSVDLSGLKEVLANLGMYGKTAIKKTAGALYREAEQIMTTSKQNFVPVDWGTLKGSGHVETPKLSGSTITVTLGYGGAAAEYALRVHEDLEARHKVGEAKYLERPFLEAVHGMPERIAADLRRA